MLDADLLCSLHANLFKVPSIWKEICLKMVRCVSNDPQVKTKIFMSLCVHCFVLR